MGRLHGPRCKKQPLGTKLTQPVANSRALLRHPGNYPQNMCKDAKAQIRHLIAIYISAFKIFAFSFPPFPFLRSTKEIRPLSAHTYLLPPSYSLPSIASIESCTMMDRDIVEPTTSTKEESKRRGSIQYTRSRSWPNPDPSTHGAIRIM